MNAWYVRDAPLGDGRWTVSGYEGDAYADGVVVDGAEVEGAKLIWRTEASDRGIVRILVSQDAVVEAPPVWFVHVDEPKASPRATNLVAFATEHFEPGTVVTSYQFATLGLPNTEQVAALRWYPDSAIVHQVFVAESWRRRRIGSVLIYAASAFHQSNGWPGALHSDGRRTDLGQQFVAANRHAQRIAPLSETMPSMDPSA